MWLKKQFQPVDNAPLVLFRIVFGFLIFAESFGAIMTGWVRRVFIEPEFTFTLIGFNWLQPPDDNYSMYIYFGLMATCGIGVMLGLYYRASLATFTLLWTCVYWMQKSSYNNHYYFLILLCLFMLVVPAHAYASLDAKRKNAVISTTCPRWCINIFIFQMWIVYTFAAIHKFYPGWVSGEFIAMNFASKTDYWLIGNALGQEWLQKAVVYGGIVFDGLIVYFLLFKKTRVPAFIISIVFHLFNSFVFQIGIFPYLMIGLAVFFFEPESVRRIFFKSKPIVNYDEFPLPKLGSRSLATCFVMIVYFSFQFYLPLRHHLYKGDVFYTEEGHRLAWRMMLRYKSGNVKYNITSSDSTWVVKPRDFLTRKQSSAMPGKPDMVWQFAQYLDKKYKKEGFGDVEVRAEGYARLNGEPIYKLVDETVDLSAIRWQSLKHADWILTPDK
ncbi:MAG: HTTM domain-containing protein [Roseivirga sp.]